MAIDTEKMKALAKLLRRVHADCNNSLAAADAIDTLLAALEASDQKRKEAVLDAEKAREERNRGQVKINAEWIRRTAELRAALEAAAADTERLDFLIDRQAWVQWAMRDGSIRQCQVYDQDEDENYHILSGDDRYFNTPRDAIDAALSQLQEES
ncbi:hypothetical protein UA18_02430 [Burkholderia multivorans]|uniref:Ead/Ea22-like family protein n=1 Tax=Burkholderia multivorans TaxID=87883 RepID=A0ABD7LL58_9BURK|nr:hypothetical protein [Burkholderia multivorans]SAJ95525.1 hypothetical protein UA18_03215 [Burkholderia multivorans]SAK20300.1 hypothetical protein UA18_02430 [Burkholderia multivorans]